MGQAEHGWRRVEAGRGRGCRVHFGGVRARV